MSPVSDTQNLLDDSGVFWVDDHLYDSLNEAQVDVWKAVRHDLAVGTATVTASQEFFSIPSPIMIPQRIVRAGVEWWATSRGRLERDNRKWRVLTVDTPKWFVPFDAETLQMVPKPDATYTLEIWGVRYPANEIGAAVLDLANTNLRITRAVQFRGAAMLAANLRAPLMEAWLAQSADYIHKARKLLSKQRSHTGMFLRPGSRSTAAHMGIRSIGKGLAGNTVFE